MSDFDHPNVLSLIGVAMGGDGMPQLITSFMGGGDLLTFLRKHSPLGGGGSVRIYLFENFKYLLACDCLNLNQFVGTIT